MSNNCWLGEVWDTMLDKRNQRSRAALRKALVELMREKSVNRISVKELCEHARVNRSTFYGSYKDVYQLLLEVHTEAFERMNEQLRDVDSCIWSRDTVKTRAALARVLEYMKNNRDLFVLFLQNNDEQLFEANLLSYFSGRLGGGVQNDADRYTYLYHMMGAFAVLCTWLLGGCAQPEEKLAEYIHNLIHSHASAEACWLESSVPGCD